MDLKNFVSETLTQIIEGVKEAQTKAKKLDAVVSPQEAQHELRYEQVELDVALTASTEQSSGAGAGLAVAGFFGGGMKTTAASSDQQLNRIRFKIPIEYPQFPYS